MKKVQILMSVYNGEKYIREQLDSIVSQVDCDVMLLVRDDGSGDATAQIIGEYRKLYPWIEYYEGENKGACASFFDLVQHASADADYYAFCDQDDVWKPDKLVCAVNMLEAQDGKKSLYCSPTRLVDASLHPLNDENYPVLQPSFGNAVIENICTGCTAVFSKELWNLMKEKIPVHAYMHDWWLYLVASCFGSVCYDTRSYILYRQHGNNTLGGKEGALAHFRRRLHNYSSMKHYVPAQLEEFSQLYGGEMSAQNRQILDTMLLKTANPFLRMRIFRAKEIARNRKIDNMIYKIMFLFWRIGK